MRILIAALAVIGLVGGVSAQTQMPYQFQSTGYCQMTTALSSAVTVATANCSSGSVPVRVALMSVCVTVAAIRYRDDGTAPTASVGMPVGAGTCINYSGDPRALQIIQQASGAVVDILFYS